jgi:hypothetical protein
MTEHGGSRWALAALDGFAGLAALVGTTMALTGWPYRAPLTWLDGTPFSDYTVPGLILGVVALSAVVAAGLSLRSPAAGAAASVVAGGLMMGWIVGEWLLVPAVRFDFADVQASLRQMTWQQPFYFLVGLAMVLLAARVAPGGWRPPSRVARAA